jgi:uncharacterized protein (DUF1501 family)
MQHFHISTRRNFLKAALKFGGAAALSTLVDIPWVMKKALAAEGLGQNGKKLLFIFLRGANDGLNSCVPIMDEAYNSVNRPSLLIPKDPAVDYTKSGAALFPENTDPTKNPYDYSFGIPLGNQFSALHPALKFLAPLYNAGDLALAHRVGYPKQSRSHFDSQIYWESGKPRSSSKDGIFYRTIMESGLANSAPLTGVSFQSSLPLTLRGSDAAMTNLKDPQRYSLMGVPNNSSGQDKAQNLLKQAALLPFPDKKNRNLLDLQYRNLLETLQIFADLDFTENGNNFISGRALDGESSPYHLFPTTNEKNGGYDLHSKQTSKYVVDPGFYDYFENLKAAAIVLNKTDAIIAGTELGGFDNHSKQGGAKGQHAELLQAVGWSLFALKEYFSRYADKAAWKDVVVVTMSEFGRTTVENSDAGTDHAEAGLMFVAGGSIQGYGKGGRTSGVFGGAPSDAVPWTTGQRGSMFGVSNRYLKRALDYRSILGELIRGHLGATQEQLNRIIPGYAVPGESLARLGTSTIDGAKIMGEAGLL